jgi:tetratricopeptide (TPR) repeat protein
MDDFIDDRARDFVGREQMLGRLIEFATARRKDVNWIADEWAADAVSAAPFGSMYKRKAVVNPSPAWAIGLLASPRMGLTSGKSTLFSELHRRLRSHDVLLLAHAVQASAQSTSVRSMFLCWIDELATALRIGVTVAESAPETELEAAFMSLVSRMAERRRVIVLLDGADQLEPQPRERFEKMLGRSWPENARLIFTAQHESDAAPHGVECHVLPRLSIEEARALIGRICSRYHRTFEPKVIEALLAKKGRVAIHQQFGFSFDIEGESPCRNPLWLAIAVEELNLVDGDDFARAERSYGGAPHERIQALMLDMIAELPFTVHDLYKYTIKRAERAFGPRLARGFLAVLTLVRSGLRESDFHQLLPRASGESWDELRFSQLRRLFRAQLRQRGTLGQWEFSHQQMPHAIRSLMQDWREFRTLPDDWVTAEQAVHAMLADHFLSLPTDDPLHLSETAFHLVCARDFARAAAYFTNPSRSPAELQGAERAFAGLKVFGYDGVSGAAELIGDVRLEREDLAAALASYRARREILALLAQRDPDNSGWWRDLSVTCNGIGDVLVARGNLPDALKSYRDGLAIREWQARSRPDHGEWQYLLSVAHERVGNVQKAQGDFADALKSYRSSLAIRMSRGRDTSVSYRRISGVQVIQGDLAGALQSRRNGLAPYEHLAGQLEQSTSPDKSDHATLAFWYQEVAEVLAQQGDAAGALKMYRGALVIIDHLVQIGVRANSAQPSYQLELVELHLRIAAAQRALRDLAAELQSCRQAVALMERVMRYNPRVASRQRILASAHGRLGEAQQRQGDLAGATLSYRQEQDIMQRVVRLDCAVDWQRGLATAHDHLGDARMALADPAGALELYQEALAIRERLTRQDATNVVWQHALATSHGKLMLAYRKQGDSERALAQARAGLPIMERLTALAPGNLQWKPDHDLFKEALPDPPKRSIWARLSGS